MRYFFDTEFIDDGSTIDLISIGIVCDDGRELYMVSNEYDESKATPWLRKHVLNHIGARQLRHSRRDIATAIVEFTAEPLVWEPEMCMTLNLPDFWAWYGDYDWVVLCQLYGRMAGLPDHFPHFAHDLRQHMEFAGVQKHEMPKQSGTKHHALEDARWVQEAFNFVEERRICPF